MGKDVVEVGSRQISFSSDVSRELQFLLAPIHPPDYHAWWSIEVEVQHRGLQSNHLTNNWLHDFSIKDALCTVKGEVLLN